MGSIINSFADEEFEVKRCLIILIKIMKLHGEFESKPRKFTHLNTTKLHWGLLWWFSSKEIKVKISQLCTTLWEPTDYRIQGILQARTLEWVAFPFSSGSFKPRTGSRVSSIAEGYFSSWAIREAQKESACKTGEQEMQVWFLRWEDPLEEGMATHSSILACKVPWTEEPGELQFIMSQRVRHNWSD